MKVRSSALSPLFRVIRCTDCCARALAAPRKIAAIDPNVTTKAPRNIRMLFAAPDDLTNSRSLTGLGKQLEIEYLAQFPLSVTRLICNPKCQVGEALVLNVSGSYEKFPTLYR
ncbi:MAG: hypothetical protein WB622_11305, partial [Acidobacteriaceae bacterium]